MARALLRISLTSSTWYGWFRYTARRRFSTGRRFLSSTSRLSSRRRRSFDEVAADDAGDGVEEGLVGFGSDGAGILTPLDALNGAVQR